MAIFVGVGDLAVSANPGEILKTVALGSCIGLVAICRRTKVTGLLHFQLPESSINAQLAREKPGTFADSGMKLLLEMLKANGGNLGGLIIKVVGGAQIMDPNNVFNIGKKNYLAAKKVLWAQKLGITAEDVGGNFSRTLYVTVGEEIVHLTSPGKENWQI